MNLDELQSIRDRERQSDSLQQLREDFYVEVGEFVQELRDEREAAAERADDPFDAPEVNRLTDDIKTAEQTVEAIYERRVGKLVKMASFAAADMPTQDEGLTAEERELFERMVAAIEGNRETVMSVVDGEDPPATPARAESGTATDTEPPSDTTAPEPRSGTPEPGARDGREPADAEPVPPTDAEPRADDGGVDAADLMAGSGPEDEAAADAASPTPPEGTADVTAETDSTTGPSGRSGEPEPNDPARGSPTGADAERADAPRDGTDGETGPVAGATDGTGEDERSNPARHDGGTRAVDRETVRITDDVGQIFGVDEREYDLSREDVVTLPAENAAPLVERDVAERLE
ncbi:DNA replication complex subunit Gins51 [Halorientalis marina]|uniref:DNA replication complex subunit Gins51 n=1 Tax=Halorientalis marina TaxID=2931976 RepID=UPI001FF5579F|nr:hypothetical protein [Halorientalis marina]